MKKIEKINGRYSPKHGWKMVISKMIYDYVNSYKNKFPENLKWEELLYIISRMEYKIFSKKYRNLIDDYIPFPSAELKSYKSDYKKYLDFLLRIGVLDKENYSTTQQRCTKYKFEHKKIYSLGYRTFDIKNLEIKRSIKQPKNDCFLQGYKDKDVEHLTKWFDDDLQFDEKKYSQLLPSILTKKEKMYNKNDDDSVTRRKHLRIQSYHRSAGELLHKNFRMSRNKDSDNRLHTNLTNLSKKLRQFVKYKGETLHSLDIKNSQPFFIIALIEGLINKNNNIIRNINKVYGNNNNGIISTISSTFLSDKGFQEEFEILRKWILEGVFYDEIIGIYNLQKGKFDEYEVKVFNVITNKTFDKGFKCIRDASKALTLRLLYTPAKKKDKHYKAFKSRFPKICDFFVFLKNYSGRKDSYKKFPKLLQHIESDCIIDNVTKKIAKKYPHAPIFTIHDSVVTTEEYIDEFQDLMYSYISEYTYGLTPKLSKECWCADDEITYPYLEAA